jgi:hypothetical protein
VVSPRDEATRDWNLTALAAISLNLALFMAGSTGLGLSPLVAGGQTHETCGAALANLPTRKEFPWTNQETWSSG